MGQSEREAAAHSVRSAAAEEAAFAHELAHGLSSLLVNVESALKIVRSMTAESPEDREDLQEHLEFIRREAQSQVFHALTVIHHRVPSYAVGLLRPEFVWSSPLAVLEEMLVPYEQKAAERGIRIEYTGMKDVEEFPKIELELNSVRRVFHNVLSNAIKYSYSGGGQRDRFIRIWGQRHDATAKLWAVKVENYGIGIKPEEIVDIFKPGYRGILAQQENTFGTGLGLADVQACMQRHGGTARIESRHTHEQTYVTTMTLVFPRTTNASEAFKS